MRRAMYALPGLLFLTLACGGDDNGPTDPGPNPEPDVGDIQVSTATSGAALDPDGYSVTLDGAADRSIGLNGVTTFSDVEVGAHQVELAGLADNCSANGSNPATAAVTKDATAQVAFDVVCEALPIGSVEVSTTVVNNFDPDGFQVLVGGASQGTVEVNGSATFDDLPAGVQPVELTGIAPNCAVDGDNPASVTIPTGGAATASFSVTCASPPGGRILYSEYSGGGATWGVMNADGSGRMQLAEVLGCCRERPAWSPDGSQIAYNSEGSDGGSRDIWVMNQDGSDRRQLTADPADDFYPDWSPDGTRIVFERCSDLSHCDLWIVAADGSGAANQLMNTPDERESHASWSPDGSRIAYSHQSPLSGPDRQVTIRVVEVDGTNAVSLTGPHPVCDVNPDEGPQPSDYDPAWSPDGERLVLARRDFCHAAGEPATSELIVINADGSGATSLGVLGTHLRDPNWSPDGTQIVYADLSENGSIGVINADGTGQTVLLQGSNSTWFEEPDWGP